MKASSPEAQPVKTPEQIEEEKKQAEKARIANERANNFLRNRNNA